MMVLSCRGYIRETLVPTDRECRGLWNEYYMSDV